MRTTEITGKLNQKHYKREKMRKWEKAKVDKETKRIVLCITDREKEYKLRRNFSAKIILST